MTTEYIPTIEDLIVFDHWKACGGHDEEALPLTTRARTLVNDDTVSRTRPDEPLWLHPTVLGPNYTKERNASILRTADPWYETTCNDGQVYPGVLLERKAVLHDFYPSAASGMCNQWPMKMRLKIQDTYVNIGADLVELNETAKMFREFAILMRDGWRRYVKRRVRRRRRKLRPTDVAAAELMTAYGITPTLGTLYDVSQKLASTVRVPRIRRLVVTDVEERSFSESFSTGDNAGFTFTGSVKTSKRAICYVRYAIDETTTGLSLGNPATWVWEKIPFSFVADWALPIGDYLQSLTAMHGVTFASGTLSYASEFSAKASYSGSEWLSERDGDVSQVMRGRMVLTDVPFPSFPGLNFHLGLKRTMNAMALLTVLSSKHRPRTSF